MAGGTGTGCPLGNTVTSGMAGNALATPATFGGASALAIFVVFGARSEVTGFSPATTTGVAVTGVTVAGGTVSGEAAGAGATGILTGEAFATGVTVAVCAGSASKVANRSVLPARDTAAGA